ncbi:MAG: type II toxin-antitoxin system VapC family toxin [Chloroflexota bacterium]|nr:type II toxin-antitoxin system VapC family toxin [Chloroflexota bacterium]MBI5705132.1 type II toxin-antitoxin system VapC family toxin [Chloroflexota bacterium]
MAAKVLDSYALLAFFEDEPGADFVRGLIHKAVEGDVTLLMTVVNLGEVWYAIARNTSPEIADQYIHEIKGMGIEIVEADWNLTRQAAVFKANGNISYADCFAAALAKLKKAELVTGDKEFKPLEGEIKIVWV